MLDIMGKPKYNGTIKLAFENGQFELYIAIDDILVQNLNDRGNFTVF